MQFEGVNNYERLQCQRNVVVQRAHARLFATPLNESVNQWCEDFPSCSVVHATRFFQPFSPPSSPMVLSPLIFFSMTGACVFPLTHFALFEG